MFGKWIFYESIPPALKLWDSNAIITLFLSTCWLIAKLLFFWSGFSLCSTHTYIFRIKSKCPKSGRGRGWRQMPGQYFMKIVSCRYIWNPVHIHLEHKTRNKIDRKSLERELFKSCTVHSFDLHNGEKEPLPLFLHRNFTILLLQAQNAIKSKHIEL